MMKNVNTISIAIISLVISMAVAGADNVVVYRAMNMDGNTISNLPNPSAASEAATKAYVDSLTNEIKTTGVEPSGTAGGDLTGTYPNPTIADGAVDSAAIQDSSIGFQDLGQNTAAQNNIIVWNGTAWEAMPNNKLVADNNNTVNVYTENNAVYLGAPLTTNIVNLETGDNWTATAAGQSFRFHGVGTVKLKHIQVKAGYASGMQVNLGETGYNQGTQVGYQASRTSAGGWNQYTFTNSLGEGIMLDSSQYYTICGPNDTGWGNPAPWTSFIEGMQWSHAWGWLASRDLYIRVAIEIPTGYTLEVNKGIVTVRDTLQLDPKSSAPANPTAGTLYFDSNLNTLRCYDGTAWKNCW